MTATAKVVLLACGSFNPPTIMHLRMFEIARDHLHKLGRYKVVGGIISPVHDSYGKKDLASAKHRCSMVQQALTASDWIKIDSWECSEESWTETRIVLEHHQNVVNSLVNDNLSPHKRPKLDNYDSLGNNVEVKWDLSSPARVMLLCGADLLESFGTPGLWKDEDIAAIVSSYGLVVITREGSNPYKFIYESDVLSKYQMNIHIVTEWITNEVSATKIRRALRRNDSIKYLVPDSVIDYIKSHKLYGSDDNKYSSVLLTPSPNTDSDMLDALGNVIRAEDQDSPNGTAQRSLLVPTHILGRALRIENEVKRAQGN